MERNLSVELRPQKFEDFIGCEHITGPILEGIKQGRIDSTYMFFGPPGCGKTSMARAVAWYINNNDLTLGIDLEEPDTGSLSADEIRQLIIRARYNPWTNKYKCIILDEAQKISTAAQEILLKALEEPCPTTVWFICSSDPGKLSGAFRRRGGSNIMPTLDAEGISKLVSRVLKYTNTLDKNAEATDLVGYLLTYQITSPGLVVRAAERLVTGVSAEEAAKVVETTSVDTFAIAKAAAVGKWSDVQKLLSLAPISAAKDIRGVVSSYFKSILLKSEAGSSRANRCVWAIEQMAGMANQNQFEDGLIWSATCAAIYKICIGQAEYLKKS